jgi:predicted nucleotidyltransferase
MMNNRFALEEVFGSRGRIKALRRLARVPALTGRQVAELTGMSSPGASKALEALWATGAVSKRRVGSAWLYSLNWDNAIVDSVVLPALAAEEHLSESMLADIVREYSPLARSLVLFGSIARGDESERSDVDLLAVVDDEAACEKTLEHFYDNATSFDVRYGRALSLHCVSLRLLEAPDRPAYLDQALKDGVLLWGERVKGVVRSA